jgi:hypothetical protein
MLILNIRKMNYYYCVKKKITITMPWKLTIFFPLSHLFLSKVEEIIEI